MSVRTSNPRKRWRWPCVAGIVVAVGLTASRAVAAPIADYPLPSGSATIYHLAPASTGGVWFLAGDRVGRVGASGSVEAMSPELTGRGVASGIAVAANGGVWVLGAGPEGSDAELTLVEADGDVGVSPTLPEPSGGSDGVAEDEALAAGADGRAWLLRCHLEGEGQSCGVDAVTTSGEVSSYPVPSLDYTSGPGGKPGGYLGPRIYPTASGVWVTRTLRNENGKLPQAAFVTYSGVVASVGMPAGSELLGPSTGEDAWWEREEGSKVTVGQVSVAGAVSDEHTREANREYPNVYTNEVGRNGGLLWSESTPWSEEQAGRMGVYPATGGAEREYVVPFLAVGIVVGLFPGTDTPGGWSGQCEFGDFLYEASNGNLWVVSAGHPTRLSVLTSGDTFSTFIPVPNPMPGTLWNLGISAPVESSGRLWFAVDEDESGEELLAAANPLEPPPGEPEISRKQEGEEAARDTATSGKASSRDSSGKKTTSPLASARVMLKGLRAGHARVELNLPSAGTLLARLSARGRHGALTIAQGSKTRESSGTATITLHPTHAGLSWLRKHSSAYLTLKLTLKLASGLQSRVLKLLL